MADITIPNRQFVGSARPATLTAQLDSSSQGPIQCDSLAGWPSGIGYDEFVVTVGRGTPTEERILCTSTSGNTLVVKQRGWDDTLSVSHEIGESVEHTISATDMQDSNDHITSKVAHGSDGNIVGEARLAEVLGTTDLIPPGLVAPWAGAAAPSGWLLCDGATLQTSLYPKLYAALGTRYGSGGAGTFNLPDLRNRVPVGLGQAPFDALNNRGGATSVTLTEANLPAHVHSIPGHTHSIAAHTHTGPSHAHSIALHQHAIDHDHPAVTTGGQSATHYHVTDTVVYNIVKDIVNTYNKNGSAQGVNNFSIDSGGRITTANQGDHTHAVDIPNFGGASGVGGPNITGAEGTGATGSTPLTTATAGAGNTGSVGTAAAVNVLQPYITLNYIIKHDQAAAALLEVPA